MEGDRRWKARIGGARSEPDGSEPREKEREIKGREIKQTDQL